MAIAFDSSSDTSISGFITSFTQSHTCTGSDRILLVGVTVFDSPYDVITGVTYNGVSMTLIGKQFRASNRGTHLYCLVAPSTGANDIVVSCSSSVRVGVDGVSFTGASQTGQPEASSTTEIESTTHTLTLTVSTDQSILVASIFSNRTEVAGANTTIVGGAINNVFVYSTSPVGTGSQSLVTTQSDTTWAEFVYAVIKPAGGGGGSPTPLLSMMGVGS